jgi:hypothetical protein
MVTACLSIQGAHIPSLPIRVAHVPILHHFGRFALHVRTSDATSVSHVSSNNSTLPLEKCFGPWTPVLEPYPL